MSYFFYISYLTINAALSTQDGGRMMTDEMKLVERKQELLKIKSDSAIYLLTYTLTEELEARVENFKKNS